MVRKSCSTLKSTYSTHMYRLGCTGIWTHANTSTHASHPWHYLSIQLIDWRVLVGNGNTFLSHKAAVSEWMKDVCVCVGWRSCVRVRLALCASLSSFKTSSVAFNATRWPYAPLEEGRSSSEGKRSTCSPPWYTAQDNSGAQECELASASWDKLSLMCIWMCLGTVCGYISISK